MPRKPDGDVAMTSTERNAPPLPRTSAEGRGPDRPPEARPPAGALQIERLEKALAAATHQEPATAKSATKVVGDEHFSEKSKLTIADAIRVHKARLDKSFEQTVGKEVRRRIAAANDSVRGRLKKADQTILQFERERGKRGVFSETEFTTIIKCLELQRHRIPSQGVGSGAGQALR